MKKKLALGQWIEPLLRGMLKLRFLRGSRLDPFARSPARRCERELVDWYESVLEKLAFTVEHGSLAVAIRIAGAPARIRGYEELKLERAARVREDVDRELAAL